MIHGVFANQLTFHPVHFTAGLNVIVAERAETSTQKDTRNGLGKSTLIEIIDFCLGANATKGKGLLQDALEEWAFTIDITLAGNRVKANRAIATPNRISIEGATKDWIEQPDTDEETGERVFNLERWRTVLGWALFGVPRTNDALKYKPSFRSLISYFVRRGPDAYSDPFRHFRQQKTWDIQLHIGYLLSLNWEYASRWQELKDQADGIKALEQAIASGALEGMTSAGELETERIQLGQEVQSAHAALVSFKVHPQYEAVQRDADRLTTQLHTLTNENILDRRRLTRFKEAVAEEVPPRAEALEDLYREAGLVFSEAGRKTLAEAREFHNRVIVNRREFLQAEITRIERSIRERNTEIERLTTTRATSLEILRTHGALEEMTKLQERNAQIKAQLEKIEGRIRDIKQMNTSKRDVRVAKTELTKFAEQDHEQRREAWSDAVRIFNDHSQALYNTPGKLIIDIADTGYKFDVEIERSSSEGIGKMKVFCFDLTILQLVQKVRDRIDFLVHDSILYDGVDSRQRALALELAARLTADDLQYICTLNSDMIPREDFSKDFDFDQHVRLTLTDKTQAGSLLGIRFERRGE